MHWFGLMLLLAYRLGLNCAHCATSSLSQFSLLSCQTCNFGSKGMVWIFVFDALILVWIYFLMWFHWFYALVACRLGLNCAHGATSSLSQFNPSFLPNMQFWVQGYGLNFHPWCTDFDVWVYFFDAFILVWIIFFIYWFGFMLLLASRLGINCAHGATLSLSQFSLPSC